MAEINNREIVLLLEDEGRDSINLFKSFERAGYKCHAFIVDNNGFMAEGLQSVYGYFMGDFSKEDKLKQRPLFFNEITVPKHWEIKGSGKSGTVYDLNHERGRIFFANPTHDRRVKVVDWLDDNGVVRSCDHYNQYGAIYARTVFNKKGEKVNKSYFSPKGQVVIEENYVTKDIILNEADATRIFRSKVDFILYFFEKTGLKDYPIYYNSLSTPFFISESLESGDMQDILFWQEPKREDIPGNMQIILQKNSTRTKRIMVQNKQAYEKLIELGADASMVHQLGYIYPFERESKHRPEVLICTNSDQIEGLSEIVDRMPNVHFSISAITEMSSKLMREGKKSNVSLYPNVKLSVQEDLFKKCDVYLDINHYGEIFSAVYRAFLNNQLIYAFDKTIHSKNYIVPEHVFATDNVDGMIAELNRVINNHTIWDEEILKQRNYALSEEEENYQNL